VRRTRRRPRAQRPIYQPTQSHGGDNHAHLSLHRPDDPGRAGAGRERLRDSHAASDQGGGPANSTITIAFYIYNLAFSQGRYGLAAAVSYVLFAAILGITLLQRRLLGRDVVY